MPLTTASNVTPNKSERSAAITQSTGFPSDDHRFSPRGVRQSGLCIVIWFDTAERFPSGASTYTSHTVRKAFSSAHNPSPSMPSSLVSKMLSRFCAVSVDNVHSVCGFYLVAFGMKAKNPLVFG